MAIRYSSAVGAPGVPAWQAAIGVVALTIATAVAPYPPQRSANNAVSSVLPGVASGPTAEPASIGMSSK